MRAESCLIVFAAALIALTGCIGGDSSKCENKWIADSAPDNLPNKKLDEYKKKEKEYLAHSSKIMEERGIKPNIVPKNLWFVSDNDLLMPTANVPEGINIVPANGNSDIIEKLQERLKQLGATSKAKIVKEPDWKPGNHIGATILTALRGNSNVARYIPEMDLPCIPGSYAIITLERGRERIYTLAANDEKGLQSAVSVFCALLRSKNGKITLPDVLAIDWPPLCFVKKYGKKLQ